MKSIIYIILISTLLISNKTYAGYEDLTLIQSLKGNWAFSIGFDDEWILPGYNDSDWESIRVPSAWEDEGFNGYNGYAFYRKKVNISSGFKGRILYLNMGYIDDVDEVYFNGRKIGSTGGFPPKYLTAYNAERIYYIPEEYIRFDAVNVIAAKVYDTEQAGGITGGDPGIYAGKNAINLDVNLQSAWKFREGDDPARKEISYDDSGWKELFVPGQWEDQGYRDYDGFGWYRKTFVYNTVVDDRMVIVLGKIDDIDAVYINGVLVGSTGYFPPKDRQHGNTGQEYNAFRGYYLPAGLLKKGQKNVIAVRVLDTGGVGGIYEGPVGLLSQKKYIEYWKKLRKDNY